MLEGFSDAVDRRTLLQRMVLLLGGSLIAGVATWPVEGIAADGLVLDEVQRATLSAFADTLIPATDTPGAIAVGVPSLLEAMMAQWAAPATRIEMIAGLDRLALLGGGFSALSPQQRLDALLPYDAAALTITGPTGESVAERIAGPPRSDRGYYILRSLVLDLYYFSEVGLTQELTYTAVPGRWDPSVPLTPSSRAYGGF